MQSALLNLLLIHDQIDANSLSKFQKVRRYGSKREATATKGGRVPLEGEKENDMKREVSRYWTIQAKYVQ